MSVTLVADQFKEGIYIEVNAELYIIWGETVIMMPNDLFVK